MRLYGLDAHGLWIDEQFSVSSACGGVLTEPIASGAYFTPTDFWREDSLPRTVRAVIRNDGGNGILYFLLLRAWVGIAGTSDFAIRLPSVAMGVLTVGWTFGLARRLATPAVAWWAGGITAFHPLLVRYSQEARPYAMAAALAALCTLAFVRMFTADPESRAGFREAAGYAVTATCLLLTHYLAAGLLIAHLAFALIAGRRGRALQRTVLALAAATLLASLWMPVGGAEGLQRMARTARNYRGKAQGGQDADRFLRPLDARMVGAGLFQIASPVVGGAVHGWGVHLWQVAPLFLVPGALVVVAWRSRRRLERVPDALALILGLSVVPIGLSLALALAAGYGVSFLPRYGIFAAPFAAVALAFGMASGARLARAMTIGQGALMAASLVAVYVDTPYHRGPNPYARLAVRIRETGQAQVIHRTWIEARMVNLHLPPGPLPRQRVMEQR